MIIKLIQDNEVLHIINSEECSEYSKKLILAFKDARKKSNRYRICEGTQEEWENHVKEWNELMEHMEDSDE